MAHWKQRKYRSWNRSNDRRSKLCHEAVRLIYRSQAINLFQCFDRFSNDQLSIIDIQRLQKKTINFYFKSQHIQKCFDCCSIFCWLHFMHFNVLCVIDRLCCWRACVTNLFVNEKCTTKKCDQKSRPNGLRSALFNRQINEEKPYFDWLANKIAAHPNQFTWISKSNAANSMTLSFNSLTKWKINVLIVNAWRIIRNKFSIWIEIYSCVRRKKKKTTWHFMLNIQFRVSNRNWHWSIFMQIR